LIRAFTELGRDLAQTGWREKAGKSSLLSGGSITVRLFTRSKTAERDVTPSQEEIDLLDSLTDE
jgi:hypothetical protein